MLEMSHVDATTVTLTNGASSAPTFASADDVHRPRAESVSYPGSGRSRYGTL